MGLDGVELILDIEEEFRVEIPDDEAGRMTTVGELWDYLKTHAAMSDPETCATSAAFYALRRGLTQVAGVPREEIRPATELPTLFPKEARRNKWHALQREIDLTLPNLVLATWLRRALDVAGYLGAGAIAAGVWYSGWQITAALLVMPCWAALMFLLEAVATPWKTELNSGWSTAGGLARVVVGLNPNAWRADQRQSAEVRWERLRALISKQLGVPLNLVAPEARFVIDLGMA